MLVKVIARKISDIFSETLCSGQVCCNDQLITDCD